MDVNQSNIGETGYRKVVFWLCGGLIALRIFTLLSSTLDGLQGYGDFYHFYNLAEIPGWPYISYWSEFPPIFPFLIEILYQISGGARHVFVYLLYFLLSLADLGNLWLFSKLALRLRGAEKGIWLVGIYCAILAGLAYTWWYFDSLAVLCMLLGLWLMLENKPARGGLILGLGGLIKFFPLVVLVAVWKKYRWNDALKSTLIALLIVILGYGALWLASPEFTEASLASQGAKGSWETVWALIDGNYQTGNFGPLVERLDATTAYLSRGNPAKISPWITLLIAGGFGFWRLLRAKKEPELRLTALVALAWVIFALWSPGWSVQWVLYLIPFVLVLLDVRQALLMSALLVLVNLMEWPLLLSRGMFWTLPATVGLRTLLFFMLVLLFDQAAVGWQDSRSARLKS